MNDKIKTLQAIINNCLSHEYDLTDYDFTQPDAMDESDSGGVWDLAGDIAGNLLDIMTINDNDDDVVDSVRIEIQSLLYNLMCNYKDERDDDDETKGGNDD